jgi:hypothetical protein
LKKQERGKTIKAEESQRKVKQVGEAGAYRSSKEERIPLDQHCSQVASNLYISLLLSPFLKFYRASITIICILPKRKLRF